MTVTALGKTKAVKDIYCTIDDGEVHEGFDVMLNQISSSSHKFYRLQVIHHKSCYSVFSRAGSCGGSRCSSNTRISHSANGRRCICIKVPCEDKQFMAPARRRFCSRGGEMSVCEKFTYCFVFLTTPTDTMVQATEPGII